MDLDSNQLFHIYRCIPISHLMLIQLIFEHIKLSEMVVLCSFLDQIFYYSLFDYIHAVAAQEDHPYFLFIKFVYFFLRIDI